VAYKPLRDSPRLVPLISAIGMSIFLQNWVALGQGARDMAVPALLPGAFASPAKAARSSSPTPACSSSP
jgi:branched-chain amino acid transport system permease protein